RDVPVCAFGLGGGAIPDGGPAGLRGGRHHLRLPALANGADPASAIPMGAFPVPDASVSPALSGRGTAARSGALRDRVRLERSRERSLRHLLRVSRRRDDFVVLAAPARGARSPVSGGGRGDGRREHSIPAFRGGIPGRRATLRVQEIHGRDPRVFGPAEALSLGGRTKSPLGSADQGGPRETVLSRRDRDRPSVVRRGPALASSIPCANDSRDAVPPPLATWARSGLGRDPLLPCAAMAGLVRP